jgi:hypothetical protein
MPRLRVAVFSERMTVTAFDDLFESGITLFVGSPWSPWRSIVQAIIDSEEYCTLNPNWPESISIVSPSHLKFLPAPNTALCLIALTWLWSEWIKAVELLLRHSDEEIAIANKDNGLPMRGNLCSLHPYHRSIRSDCALRGIHPGSSSKTSHNS